MLNASERTPGTEELGLLRSMRARHPGWQIQLEGPVWIAVNRPAQTSVHIIADEVLADLDGKLNHEDGPAI